jgi:hypothetical protein
MHSVQAGASSLPIAWQNRQSSDRSIQKDTNRPMNVSQAKPRLQKLLSKADFNRSSPEPEIAWQVYKQFSDQKAGCEDNRFFVQLGCYRFTGELLFYLDFVRQFSIYSDDGEYDHMQQLHIEFTRKPDEALKKIDTNLWAYDFDRLDSFFTAVENMKEFQLAIHYSGWKCEIYQHKI